MPSLVVAALYKFVALPAYAELRQPLLEFCQASGVCGSLLLADEGINGTIAGPAAGIQAVLEFLEQQPGLADLELKHSSADEAPFERMKVRLKREIVTMGIEGIDPTQAVGTYVEPKDWNRLLEDPDVIVIDTRNEMEVAIGSFRGAIDPGISSFREFPEWMRSKLSRGEQPKLAMFCTGGIRCEKSTAFLKQEGFEEVYHLKGGILKYLEQVPAEESLWQGQCYVFDKRVSVGHGLVQGDYSACHACGIPLDRQARESPDYREGQSCPSCVDQQSEEQRRRFAERQRQRLQEESEQEGAS